MDIRITIDQFDGPMDLLLHLIKKSDIDICEISIVEITEQYLQYIEKMEQLDLNIASEYLIMAAELIEIKSSLLLPKPNIESDEFEEDPRERLIKRLIEYKQYKEMTPQFRNLESQRKQIFTKEATDLKEFTNADYKVGIGDTTLNDLIIAFSKFLERKELEKPLNTTITKREYSVSERSIEIKDILRKKKKVAFEELFEQVSKDYIVVSFLSILNLAKKQELLIEQDNNFDSIIVSLRGE